MANRYTADDVMEFLKIDFTKLQSALEIHESVVNELAFLLNVYKDAYSNGKSLLDFKEWYEATGEQTDKTLREIPSDYSVLNIEAGAKAVCQHLCISVNSNPVFDKLGLKLSVITEINRQSDAEELKGVQYNIAVGNAKSTGVLNVYDRRATILSGTFIRNELSDAWEEKLFSVIENQFGNTGYDRSWIKEDFACGTFDINDMKQTVETGRLTNNMTECIQNTIDEYGLELKQTVKKENLER